MLLRRGGRTPPGSPAYEGFIASDSGTSRRKAQQKENSCTLYRGSLSGWLLAGLAERFLRETHTDHLWMLLWASAEPSRADCSCGRRALAGTGESSLLPSWP